MECNCVGWIKTNADFVLEQYNNDHKVELETIEKYYENKKVELELEFQKRKTQLSINTGMFSIGSKLGGIIGIILAVLISGSGTNQASVAAGSILFYLPVGFILGCMVGWIIESIIVSLHSKSTNKPVENLNSIENDYKDAIKELKVEKANKILLERNKYKRRVYDYKNEENNRIEKEFLTIEKSENKIKLVNLIMLEIKQFLNNTRYSAYIPKINIECWFHVYEDCIDLCVLDSESKQIKRVKQIKFKLEFIKPLKEEVQTFALAKLLSKDIKSILIAENELAIIDSECREARVCVKCLLPNPNYVKSSAW